MKWYFTEKEESFKGKKIIEYRYMNDKGNPVDQSKATKCKVTEYLEDGTVISESVIKCWPGREYFSIILYSLLAIMVLPRLLYTISLHNNLLTIMLVPNWLYFMILDILEGLLFLEGHTHDIVVAIYVSYYTYVIIRERLYGDKYTCDKELWMSLLVFYIAGICFLIFSITHILLLFKSAICFCFLPVVYKLLKYGFIKFLMLCRKIP